MIDFDFFICDKSRISVIVFCSSQHTIYKRNRVIIVNFIQIHLLTGDDIVGNQCKVNG